MIGLHDFHMHLNGSFSQAFLKETANKNHSPEVYEAFVKTKAEFEALRHADKTDPGLQKKKIDLVWKQFNLIHQIIQTLDDIQDGTVDVVANSKAQYLEIRTTPKVIQGYAVEEYVKAFKKGLQKARVQYGSLKEAHGILSLNREFMTFESARDMVDLAVQSKLQDGLINGIDISGNPIGKRILTGETLKKTLRYALSQPIGIAIHIGEADTEIESKEIDIILDVLTEWQVQNNQDNTSNPLHGKVRLGHAIFLNEMQCQRVRTLGLPVEVAPTCHELLNWYHINKPHPVKNIYTHWTDPVVSGTDDETIMDANAEQEFNWLLDHFEFQNQYDLKAVHEHQSRFRF